MDKAPDAFRTISEVADELDVPQHVLRFWESRFAQIKPMKRGGGRRYYRPDDVDLLRGIRHLLYGEGYTIRGVQRILREQGVRFVQSVWQEGSVEPPPPNADDKAREGPSARDHLLLGLLPKFSRPKSPRKRPNSTSPKKTVPAPVPLPMCLCMTVRQSKSTTMPMLDRSGRPPGRRRRRGCRASKSLNFSLHSMNWANAGA